MKTTIEIADPLLREARKIAARDGLTLRTLVEQGLRLVISDAAKAPRFKLRRASFKGTGLQPELQAASWDRLRDLIYQDHGA